ncbi:MAG: ABC transporter substrate-binding protein [Defluviitaleaceae bacterium]|nr:ABC transporter substrate-binding protein [Defluviitaleaceae bacterium]
MKRFMTVVFLVALMALMAGLTACNRDDNDGVQGTTANEAGNETRAAVHSQGVTDTTIYVGNTAAVSGPFAAVGVPFNDGMLAYFYRVNNAGGVNGRRIEFVHHDDNFDAVTGLAFTEALIHDDNVFAIVGHFGTPTVGATLDMLKDTGIPVVYFASGISALYNEEAFTVAQGQNLFPVQPIFTMEGRVLIARAVEEYNASRIGVIFTSDEAGFDFIDGINNQVNRMDGIELITEQIAPMQPDVSSAVLRMAAEDVDLVIVGTLQGTLPTVINSMVTQGLDVPVITSYISADATTIDGFAADYIGAGATFPIYATAWLDIFTADGGFTDEFYDFAIGVDEFGQPDLAANAFAMAGWIAGSVFVQGLNAIQGQDITWEAYIEAMERATIDLPMGGIMNFANGQRTGTQAMALVRVDMDAGEWETIRPIETLDDILRRIGQ